MQLDPLQMLDPRVIGVCIGIVIVAYFVLRKWFFLPYIEVMQERAERIDKGRALRDEAKQITEGAQWEVASIQGKAKADAEELERSSQVQSADYRKEAMAAAVVEIDELLKKGRGEIAADAEVEAAELRSQAIECVALACERLLGKRDDVLIASAVDRALARPE